MFRPAKFDECGPLVWKERYSGYYRHTITPQQKSDYKIISKCAQQVFGTGMWMYSSEWADYIPNYFEYTKKRKPKLQQVSFDHVVFAYGIIPIIFESDDPSHYDRNYCQLKGWDYDDRVKKDRIRDLWAEATNTPLIRLRENMSRIEKEELIIKIFTDVKNSIRS